MKALAQLGSVCTNYNFMWQAQSCDEMEVKFKEFSDNMDARSQVLKIYEYDCKLQYKF